MNLTQGKYRPWPKSTRDPFICVMPAGLLCMAEVSVAIPMSTPPIPNERTPIPGNSITLAAWAGDKPLKFPIHPPMKNRINIRAELANTFFLIASPFLWAEYREITIVCQEETGQKYLDKVVRETLSSRALCVRRYVKKRDSIGKGQINLGKQTISATNGRKKHYRKSFPRLPL